MGSQQSKAKPDYPRGPTEEQREQLRKRQEKIEEDSRRRQKTQVDIEDERKNWEIQEGKLKKEKEQAEEACKLAEERANALQSEVMRYRDETASLQEEVRETLRYLKEVVEKDLAAALEAKLEAERRLWEGSRTILFPTKAQYTETRRRLQYEPGFCHFAVSGMSGSGKSSLINAFRGLRNTSRKAAPVGVVETTSQVVRYPDPSADMPYVWYDVPGAGTLSVPDWQYFTDQGLYIFDCIIVVFDARFTATDVAILRNCVFFQIPTFIVRSKSKQHIVNVAKDLPVDGFDEDDDSEDDGELDAARRTKDHMAKARGCYIQDTRRSVAKELNRAGLSPQRVYIIDKDELVKAVRGKSSPDAIDEDELLTDMFALADRYDPGSGEPPETTGSSK
ncbi:interferon-inducible GTPase-domain-containing protein [Fomitopsis betulina]|nr:interferon-inducible GTPase-domain-containing protein [Fomitopsis betulina]